VSAKILGDVRSIVAASTHASLAVFDPSGDFPSISRVSMVATENGEPVLLTSALSAHTAALKANANCSVLVGKIGPGNPMAQSRVTLFCRAFALPESERKQVTTFFIAKNPQAETYIDLPDFTFWQLKVQRVNYIAGFGRAYNFSGEQLSDKSP